MDRRPTGITIIGILQVLVGLYGIFLGLTTLLLFTGTDPYGIRSFGLLIVSALLIVGLFNLVVGWGYLSAQSWAWGVCILVSTLGAVLAIAGLASGLTVYGITVLIVNLIILSYLSTRG